MQERSATALRCNHTLDSRVGTVADVSADGEGKVTSDGTGGGLQGVGGTQDGSTGLDSVQTLPDHTDNGTRVHVLDQTGEEGLLLQVGVVVFQVFLTGSAHLQSDELIAGARRLAQKSNYGIQLDLPCSLASRIGR